MPTYEYKREDGSTFEVVQKMDEEALTECPDTGQPVKRIISGGSGSIIKGWSPDKERRKKDWKRRNPHGTTLPEYSQIIEENTEKAKEQEAKIRDKN